MKLNIILARQIASTPYTCEHLSFLLGARMTHSFDIEIAEQYGMLEAVLLNYFQFWDAKNRANEKNEHDGLYWTYNSTKAFTKLFPYASDYQIRRALKHLEEECLIKTGNYNKSAYDRTTWYALTKTAISILQKPQMEEEKTENGIEENHEPIPVNNTVDNTVDNIYVKLADDFNNICVSLPKAMKITDKRKTHIKRRVAEYGVDEIEMAFRKMEQSDFLSGRSGRWKASFDWLIKSSDNVAKVLEGQYDNKSNTTHDKLKEAFDRL